MQNESIKKNDSGGLMQILHFSDTHNNPRATAAVVRIAQKWNNAIITVTGDVCNGPNQIAHSMFNNLSNPHIFFVRGNHDQNPQIQFSNMPPAVKWQAPYRFNLKSCVLVGLDSEDNNISNQLLKIKPKSKHIQKKVLIILYHRPFSELLNREITSWANKYLPGIVSIALLHGHEHYKREFYAEFSEENLEGINIITSHVYSANTSINPIVIGCANLLELDNNGNVSIQTIYNN
jgi:predicted phosphodiesterase